MRRRSAIRRRDPSPADSPVRFRDDAACRRRSRRRALRRARRALGRARLPARHHVSTACRSHRHRMRPGRGGSDRSHPSGSLALLDELAAAPDQIVGQQPEPFERRIACLLVVIEEVDLLDDRGKKSEEHTSELQSLMRISYAVFCLKKKKITQIKPHKIDCTTERSKDTYQT